MKSRKESQSSFKWREPYSFGEPAMSTYAMSPIAIPRAASIVTPA
jgi:hypothetical protein